MSRIVVFLACCSLTLATAPIGRSQAAEYLWSISASSTNPYLNHSTFEPGVTTSYLWFVGSNPSWSDERGMFVAEFGLVSTNPANVIFSFTPDASSDWTNVGTPTSLELIVTGCPRGPLLAGTIRTQVNEPGSLCFGPSAGGEMFGANCPPFPNDQFGIGGVGLRFGGDPCGTSGGATGGCCLADGTCQDGLEWFECATAGGVFQGAGSSCSLTSCDPPLGACCLPDGSCLDHVSQSECLASGGSFQGNGSTCASTPCDLTLGACCLSNGTCLEGVQLTACQSAGGYFQGPGTTCTAAPCDEPGACCFPDGTCGEVSGAECAAAQGIFGGPNVPCSGSDCNSHDPRSYGWTISASSTDPNINVASFDPGLHIAYLWLNCSPDGLGMSAAEFAVVSTNPANVFLAFVVANGFLNLGNGTDLILGVGGCPTGPVLAGSILMQVAAPGSLCLGATSYGGKSTVDCLPKPTMHQTEWVGLDFGGGTCSKGTACTSPVSIQPESWGRIKSRYR